MDSSVSTVTGYGLDNHGPVPGRAKRFLSRPPSRHRAHLVVALSSGHRELLVWDKAAGAIISPFTSTQCHGFPRSPTRLIKHRDDNFAFTSYHCHTETRAESKPREKELEERNDILKII
jgi:hypothetical protein